jgi:hypothetical protein
MSGWLPRWSVMFRSLSKAPSLDPPAIPSGAPCRTWPASFGQRSGTAILGSWRFVLLGEYPRPCGIGLARFLLGVLKECGANPLDQAGNTTLASRLLAIAHLIFHNSPMVEYLWKRWAGTSASLRTYPKPSVEGHLPLTPTVRGLWPSML